MASLDVGSLGAFIREQRERAQISVRELAKTAGVSNPYLSQIERGLRRPSAKILQQIAKGLRISAEALYIQAGILEDRHADTGVGKAIAADTHLSERQKEVLLEVYESFRRENDVDGGEQPEPATASSSTSAKARPHAAKRSSTTDAGASTTGQANSR